MGFLTATSLLGVPRWIWLAAGVFALAIIGVVAYTQLLDKQDNIAKSNQEIGRTIQREQDLSKTLERVEKGNEVRSGVEAEAAVGRGSVLYRQCLSSNRGTPENCERFLPERQTADSERSTD